MCELCPPGLTKNSVMSNLDKGAENFDQCPQLDYLSYLDCSAKCLPADIISDIKFWPAKVSYMKKISALETGKIKVRKKNCSTSPQNQQPLLGNYSGYLSDCSPHPSIGEYLTAVGSKRLEMSGQHKSTIKVRKKLLLSHFPTGSEYCIHHSAIPDFVVSKF